MVRSDGRPVERIDKHPFQLSRVYYCEKEKGDQVRWRLHPLSVAHHIRFCGRQVTTDSNARPVAKGLGGAERSVLQVDPDGIRDHSAGAEGAAVVDRFEPPSARLARAGLERQRGTRDTQVPMGIKRSEVSVSIGMRAIKVESADGRTTYLSGQPGRQAPALRSSSDHTASRRWRLAGAARRNTHLLDNPSRPCLRSPNPPGELDRAVVPEESVWTLEDAADAGNGGCGMVLTLVKMNLELFANSAEHHVVWWPRLFRCGSAGWVVVAFVGPSETTAGARGRRSMKTDGAPGAAARSDHAEIAWDDDFKDYSDLPAPVMQVRRCGGRLSSAGTAASCLRGAGPLSCLRGFRSVRAPVPQEYLAYKARDDAVHMIEGKER